MIQNGSLLLLGFALWKQETRGPTGAIGLPTQIINGAGQFDSIVVYLYLWRIWIFGHWRRLGESLSLANQFS